MRREYLVTTGYGQGLSPGPSRHPVSGGRAGEKGPRLSSLKPVKSDDVVLWRRLNPSPGMLPGKVSSSTLRAAA